MNHHELLQFRKILNMRQKHPFAVIGTDYVLDVNDEPIRARAYPWGMAEIENPEHSDLPALRHLMVK